MPAVGPKGALQPSAYRVGAAVVACRILKRGASADLVIHNTAATIRPVGISEEDQATVDKPVRVAHRPGELVRVEAGAAIAADVRITSDANGRAVTAVATNQIIGWSRNAALALGDLITVEIEYGIMP
jgi:hypothetical protein